MEYIAELSQKCGIPFSLRTFRSSVVALIVDQNPNDLKPYMSSQIGHQKSTMMDLFYWRVKMGTTDTKLTDAGKAVSLPDMHYCAGEIIRKKAADTDLFLLRTCGGFLIPFCILPLTGLSPRIPYLCSRNPFFDVYARLKSARPN